MSIRFKSPSAVMLMLIKNGSDGEEILLQKRKNTGFADGYYDFSASGHVEENESLKEAMCREAKEELNIIIKPEELEFVCLIHKNIGNGTYINAYFKALNWVGNPMINEPGKIEELKWFNINDLPANIVNDRVDAIKNYQNNIKYSEFGWNK